MPPKKRSADAMEAADEKPSYSPAFPLEPDTDLVVQSSDGTLFATQALYIRAVSSVLRATLAKPVPDEQGAHDGHRLLKLEEKAELIEMLLRYSHADKLLVDGKPSAPEWSLVKLFVFMLDKYNATSLRYLFLLEHLPRFIGSPRAPQKSAASGSNLPIQVFALSTAYGLEEVAQRALECLDHWGHRREDLLALSHRDPKDLESMSQGWRPSGVGDLPLDLLSRMPIKYVKRFCELHDKVAFTKGYSWFKAAEDFKL